MRAGLWLYLDLLARLPADAETFEVEPAAIGRDMGLPEGTIRSWLGHLRRSGYLDAVRMNGRTRVTMKRMTVPEPPIEAPPAPTRFFTIEKIQRALGETGDGAALEGVLEQYSDELITRALAGTLAVPETPIRRSRIALFIYLLKCHAHQD